jgi:hypothetical protein
MSQNTEPNDTKPVYDFQELDQAVRRWAVMSQFEQDQENYEQLKQQND